MFGKKTPEPTTRLRELSGSDYTIPKNQPDIRGWDVRDANKLKFGTVQDLIFDIRAGKVRYMVLQILDTPELELDRRTVLVPIGMAELDASDNDVFLPSVNAFQLRALPSYNKSRLGAKAEHDVRFIFGNTALGSTQQGGLAQTDVDEGFYNHEHFDDNNMLRRRQGFVSQTPTTDRPVYHNEPVRRSDLDYNDTHAKRDNDEAYRRGFEDGQRHRAETDDEYYRRTGKHRDI